MANRTWTNHNQAICMDVNLWYMYDYDKFKGKTLLIQVFHGYELITSYIKMLELVELDLPNKGYG